MSDTPTAAAYVEDVDDEDLAIDAEGEASTATFEEACAAALALDPAYWSPSETPQSTLVKMYRTESST